MTTSPTAERTFRLDALFVLVISLYAFYSCIHADFAWDDDQLVVKNRYVRRVRDIPFLSRSNTGGCTIRQSALPIVH